MTDRCRRSIFLKTHTKCHFNVALDFTANCMNSNELKQGMRNQHVNAKLHVQYRHGCAKMLAAMDGTEYSQ